MSIADEPKSFAAAGLRAQVRQPDLVTHSPLGALSHPVHCQSN
ncbi:hypothetical protein [Rhodococcus sp. LB1]|nr:hypothetical protein [Rhodococcus sp. LB1]AHK30841.1 hypothetical protein Pd630_LPD03628 [Rhodococcus opacus PD630]